MVDILIIDDEESILDFISYNLKSHGYKAHIARNGEEGLMLFSELSPGLVILDVMLPDTDGFEVCKTIRSKAQVPVLMLSVLDSETDKVLGLELGADDYLTKPFSVRELLARVKALLRRASGPEPPILLKHGELQLDTGRMECRFKDKPVSLTLKEFELLRYLMENAGLVLSRAQIMDSVWGYDIDAGERTIDSHIKSLRRKLNAQIDDDPIETVRGVGYRFRDE